MYVNATTEGGLLIEKNSGRPLTVGSPSIGIYFTESQLQSLSQLYNNTPSSVLENTFRRRKLMAIPNKVASCSNPIIRALAIDPLSSVRDKCNYINKPGTDSKITFRISRGIDGKLTTEQFGAVTSCGTFHDQIHVTEDQCSMILAPVACPTIAANHTATIIWADSLLHQDHIASYAVSCKGVCSPEGTVEWDLCGVSLHECPQRGGVTTSTPASGRRLSDAEEDLEEEVIVSLGDAMGVGMRMNCQSGSCFAVV